MGARRKEGGNRCLIPAKGSALRVKTARRLLKAGLVERTVSLHGAPELHDGSVGRKGAFAKVAAVCAFISASPLKRHTRLTFWCAITPANHSVLHRVYKTLKALGPDHIAFNQLDFITERDRAATAALFKKDLGRALNLKTSEALAAGISAPRLAAEIKKIKAERDPGVRFDLDLGPAGLKKWYAPEKKFLKKGLPGPVDGIWSGPTETSSPGH